MLSPNPEERPSIDEIRGCEWLEGNNTLSNEELTNELSNLFWEKIFKNFTLKKQHLISEENWAMLSSFQSICCYYSSRCHKFAS